jgi:hypothetical protein
VGILRSLAETNGGVLTPEAVLDFARPDDSPLHSYFEWDDSVAGEKYRYRQAQGLITKVKVTKVVKPARTVEVRAFLPIKENERGEAIKGTYKPIEDLDGREIEIIRAQMERDLAVLKRKYATYSEVFDQMLQEMLAKSA